MKNTMEAIKPTCGARCFRRSALRKRTLMVMHLRRALIDAQEVVKFRGAASPGANCRRDRVTIIGYVMTCIRGALTARTDVGIDSSDVNARDTHTQQRHTTKDSAANAEASVEASPANAQKQMWRLPPPTTPQTPPLGKALSTTRGIYCIAR